MKKIKLIFFKPEDNKGYSTRKNGWTKEENDILLQVGPEKATLSLLRTYHACRCQYYKITGRTALSPNAKGLIYSKLKAINKKLEETSPLLQEDINQLPYLSTIPVFDIDSTNFEVNFNQFQLEVEKEINAEMARRSLNNIYNRVLNWFK